MTLEKFYTTLAKVPYQWRLHTGGVPGHKKVLRSRDPHSCPVCAVANHIIGEDKYGLQHLNAAKKIGLNETLAEAIACAADGSINRDSADPTASTANIKRIRKKLLEITNPQST